VLLCFLNDYMYDFSHKLFQWILCVNSHSHILMGMWLVHNEMVTRWWLSIFIIFISFIWHPWLMTKWYGCPIILTMIKNWLQIIWYELKQTYPPPTYLLSPWKIISILLQITCKKKEVQIIEKKFTIYLNVNKALIIHFENIF